MKYGRWSAVLILAAVVLQGCSFFLEQIRDGARPFEVVKRSGDTFLVRFRFRPREKNVSSLYLVGTFNNWSCPGNDRGGKFYPMQYNAEVQYWERMVLLGPGLYNYMYLMNHSGTVIDEKSAETLPNGSLVSRILLRK